MQASSSSPTSTSLPTSCSATSLTTGSSRGPELPSGKPRAKSGLQRLQPDRRQRDHRQDRSAGPHQRVVRIITQAGVPAPEPSRRSGVSFFVGYLHALIGPADVSSSPLS